MTQRPDVGGRWLESNVRRHPHHHEHTALPAWLGE